MPPKKAPVQEPEPVEAVVEEQEPAEPEILKKCFRKSGQVYYGDCKAGYGERKGTFVRHGFGHQVETAAAIVGRGPKGGLLLETVVQRCYIGHWQDDVMVQGCYKWSDGSTYNGAFSGGSLHGHGRLTWSNSSSYEGEWHSGSMEGLGRFDSRLDLRFHQGHFQHNCLQRSDGQWVNFLEQHKSEERAQVLQGDPSGISIHYSACDELLASQGTRADAQRMALESTLAAIREQGLVPFLIADDSLDGSPLDCLGQAGLTDSTSHCASLRLAATLRRRHRDHSRVFRTTLGSALRDGAVFVVVLEDDEEGCQLTQDEHEDWFKRRPGRAVPSSPVPEDWRVEGFLDPASFPLEVFAPAFFNGRNRATAFVPGMAAAQQALGGGDHAAAPSLPLEGEEDHETLDAIRLAATASTPVPPPSEPGLTGVRFEVPRDADLATVGVPVIHWLRAAVLALGRIPAGSSEVEVRDRVLARYGRHIPLHRMAVLVLSASEPAAS